LTQIFAIQRLNAFAGRAVVRIKGILVHARKLQTLSWVPISFALFLFGAAFLAGMKSGLASSTSHLYINLTALTAVISAQSHGLKGHPYEGYGVVRDAIELSGLATGRPGNYPKNFRDPTTIKSALNAASAVEVCGAPLVSHPFNDQGLIEFTRASFALFGIDAKSTYYFYFLLTGISIGVFFMCFWRNYIACALLFSCAFAIYGLVTSYVHGNDQLISVSNPRYLSTLGIIPVLHLFMAFTSATTERISWPSLLGVLFQSALINFAVAIRSSAAWIEIGLAILTAAYLALFIFRAWRGRSWTVLRCFLLTRGAVALYIAAPILMVTSVRALYLPADCGTGLGHHTYWHNIFIGLTINPQWYQGLDSESGLKGIVGDNLPFTAARLYVRRHHLPYQTEPRIWVYPTDPQLEGDPKPFGSWQTYEQVVKQAVFEFARAHPRYTLETFVIYKPMQFFDDLRIYFVTLIKDLRIEKLIILIAMAAVVGALAARILPEKRPAAQPIGFMQAFAALAVCFMISPLPLMIAYSHLSLIADPAFLASAGLFFCLIWAVAVIALVFTWNDRSKTRPLPGKAG
jgi:hypothetical protein